MKSLALLGLLSALVGCSGGAESDPKLDTASPTANMAAPPPGPAKNIPSPPMANGGGPGAPGNAAPAAAPSGG